MTKGRHRLFDARRRNGWSFVCSPTGVWHSEWRGELHLHQLVKVAKND